VSDDMRLAIVRESEKGEDVLSIEKLSIDESPIVKLIDTTILDAINKRSSDIHIETSDQGVIIRYRIDGMLHQATEPLNVQHQSAIVSRIKVMSDLDISEKRIPQDGRFKLKIRNRHVDFRVSILPTIFGEDAVIRILDRESLMEDVVEFHLDNLGIPPRELSRMRRMISAPYGMFLMTGPTGSGKTTTLYRALSEVNSKEDKIITIEDPVEYQLRGIVQIPVNEKKGLTFAKGLRSILRHDPDKILVGEIRDSETAQIALQSALTGHLVFTTVHANSSFEVINRFIHMGIEPYNLMAALNCIAAQRLLRTLCHCKAKVKVPEGKLKESGLDCKLYADHTFYGAKGCEDCKGTGYMGRKAIIELLELDDDMREMFVKRAPLQMIKKKAVEMGTTFLRKAALQEVLAGETTLREANRVTFVEPIL
jgi:type IV pilus assembly protein PilB